jgi:plasmid replication initiation protein
VESVKDVIARFAARGPAEPEKSAEAPNLLPDRHPIRDFFLADIATWTLKDDRASMEHPIFGLSKTPDREIRRYEHNGVIITVTPSVLGRATIWDKDILIYAVSQLIEAINNGRPVSRKVRLKAYDLLVTTNRQTGGDHYERLRNAFRRLAGTRIETNIVTNGQRIREGFSLLDNWKTIEKTDTGRLIRVELTLNEWLFNAITALEVLTLNRDYFRLDGGLDRSSPACN